jgi:hypothetical protein
VVNPPVVCDAHLFQALVVIKQISQIRVGVRHVVYAGLVPRFDFRTVRAEH